jgi:hypothetical protein
MAGTVYRRRPTTTWSVAALPVAALLLALLFTGLTTSRVPALVGTAPHATLAAGHTVVHATVHWAGNRPVRGKATGVPGGSGSGLLAPGSLAALAGALELLLVGAAARRVRPRRVGRMHAGRGPPQPALS